MPRPSRESTAFATAHPLDANAIAMAVNPATAGLQCASYPGLTNQQAVQQILHRATSGPFRLTQVINDISNRMLAQTVRLGVFVQYFYRLIATGHFHIKNKISNIKNKTMPCQNI